MQAVRRKDCVLGKFVGMGSPVKGQIHGIEGRHASDAEARRRHANLGAGGKELKESHKKSSLTCGERTMHAQHR